MPNIVEFNLKYYSYFKGYVNCKLLITATHIDIPFKKDKDIMMMTKV